MYGKLTLRFLSLAALCTASSVGDFVCDAAMKEEIQFAMDQLRQLSESGVYETLELVEVRSASRSKGIYHDILNFTCVLDSPHMVHRSSEYTLLLMTALDDGRKSIAIDNYPLMKEEAIQHFLEAKIQRARLRREKAWEELSRSAMAFQQAGSPGKL